MNLVLNYYKNKREAISAQFLVYFIARSYYICIVNVDAQEVNRNGVQ